MGDEVMSEVFRTYARRYRFAHPTTEDFIATVNEVTGQDYRWFFDETFFSSDLCDYAIEVANREPPVPAGFREEAGAAHLRAPGAQAEAAGPEGRRGDGQATGRGAAARRGR